jgi:hypothetical protein
MNPPNRTLIYRVSRSGHVMGEYDIDRIVELLDSGEFLWTDLCWAQGMAGWAPLSNLRAEVAAAKAFPAAAAMPTPVASGRRRMQAPAAQTAAPQVSASGIAGWMWIVGGVTLGVLVGLLTTQLFPNIVQVDRPVEKIVEKPVEVIRTVEMASRLTSDQQAAIAFTNRLIDGKDLKVGVSLLKLSDKVKIINRIVGSGSAHSALSVVTARVESMFRQNGFKVLPLESEDYPYTIVYVGGVVLDNTDSNGRTTNLSGFHSVSMAQPITYFSTFDTIGSESMPIRKANMVLYEKRGAYYYGSNNFHKIPDLYDKSAEAAAAELRKAQDN